MARNGRGRANGRRALAAAAAIVAAAVAASAGAASQDAKSEPSRSLKQIDARSAAPVGPKFVPGELLVRFRPATRVAERRSLLQASGATVERSLPVPGLVLARVPVQAEERVAAALERMPDVLFAERNAIRRISATPNDPRFADLWGLRRIGAQQAWDRTTGSRGIVVAVVDSGVDWTHPDVVGNIWQNVDETANDLDDDDGNGYVDDVRGWDFVAEDNDPQDENGHGTHVAGTIGARGNNAAGIAGVNWNVSLMALRAGAADGSLTDADIVQAFAYARRNGAHVVNGSFGGPGFSSSMDAAIAAAPNVLFVFAAGNGGGDGVGDDNDAEPQAPCNSTRVNVICVAATDRLDRLTGFSNYGATSVDLAAPGENILSATHHRVLLGDGFETDIAGRWTASPGATGTWQRTTEAKEFGAFSLTDSPGGNYPNDALTRIETASPISLAGGSDCALDYLLRLETESGFDGFFVDAALNGTTFAPVAGWTGTSDGAFVFLSEDLSAFDGAASLDLRFGLESDSSEVFDGAHVDNVVLRCLTGTHGTDDFVLLDGTSMATPHVAGVAALALAANRTLTVAQLRGVLLGSVDRVGALAGRVVTGGRLNAARAVAAAVPPPTVSVGNVRVSEGNFGVGNALFTVSLSRPAPAPATVRFGTRNGTASSATDYVASAGTIAFATGQTTKTVPVPVRGDVRDEFDETFALQLSNPVGLTIGRGVGSATIIDDDAPPRVRVGDARIREGNRGLKRVVLAVRLSAVSEKPVAVRFGTANGSAKAPSDYVRRSGTLAFRPGQTLLRIAVSVRGDRRRERAETFFVNLKRPVNVVLADRQGRVTITNDDRR